MRPEQDWIDELKTHVSCPESTEVHLTPEHIRLIRAEALEAAAKRCEELERQWNIQAGHAEAIRKLKPEGA